MTFELFIIAATSTAIYFLTRKGEKVEDEILIEEPTRPDSFVDRLENDPVYVSRNFTWEEFTVSGNPRLQELAAQAAKSWTPLTRRNAKELAKTILEPLRRLIGKPIVILSGYRPPLLNSKSGGVSGSQHLTASAADIRPAGAPGQPGDPEDFQKIFDWAVDNRTSFGQFIFYFRGTPGDPRESHRIHVSLPGNRTGNIKFNKSGTKIYTDIYPPL